MPKKEQRRNRPALPAGARDLRAGARRGALPPAQADSRPLPRRSASAAAFKTWGVRTRSGCQVPATTPSRPPVPGAWLGARAGFSRGGCLSDLTGLQISPGRLVPAAHFRAPGWHAALPWTPKRLSGLPGGLGPSFSPEPYTRRTDGARIRTGGFSSFSELLALEPTPLFPTPASRFSQLLAKWTLRSEVKGMGTVYCNSAVAQLEGLIASCCRDWDPEALPLLRGMRRARASAALSVLAREAETARNEPRRVPQHTPSFKLTVW